MQGATSISSSDSGENAMILKALHVANFKAFAIALRPLGQPIRNRVRRAGRDEGRAQTCWPPLMWISVPLT